MAVENLEIQRHGGSDEDSFPAVTNSRAEAEQNDLKRWILLIFNVFLLAVGAGGSPLLLRIYFIHGGNRKWFSATLQTAGFPFLLVPLLVTFLGRCRRWRLLRSSCTPSKLKFFLITPSLFLYSAVIGLITGVDNYLYSSGVSYLPVSTSSLVISAQLGFTAFFAFLVVGQKFTAESINALVILTFGTVILGVHANGDRPEGESKGKYYLGFVMTLAAAVLYGLVLPLVELTYAKAKQAVTYTLVMEIQLVLGFFSTLLCLVGMWINDDYQAIARESKTFGLGKTKYYLLVVFTTVITQFFFLGVVGTVRYGSALLGGIVIALSIPVTEVLAVVFFHEKFDGEKGVALMLSLWGSTSYFYGEYKQHRQSKRDRTEEASERAWLPLPVSVSNPEPKPSG